MAEGALEKTRSRKLLILLLVCFVLLLLGMVTARLVAPEESEVVTPPEIASNESSHDVLSSPGTENTAASPDATIIANSERDDVSPLQAEEEADVTLRVECRTPSGEPLAGLEVRCVVQSEAKYAGTNQWYVRELRLVTGPDGCFEVSSKQGHLLAVETLSDSWNARDLHARFDQSGTVVYTIHRTATVELRSLLENPKVAVFRVPIQSAWTLQTRNGL